MIPRNVFSPQKPLSVDYSYDDDLEDGEARSIHSLEKRRIVKQEGGENEVDENEDGSIQIDNTLSPSPQLKTMKFNLQDKTFLKRMNSTNVDSIDNSPEDEKKRSKLARMESYEVNSKAQQPTMRKSPDARKKASGMSPDLGGSLSSPVSQAKDNKSGGGKSLFKQLPREGKQ